MLVPVSPSPSLLMTDSAGVLPQPNDHPCQKMPALCFCGNPVGLSSLLGVEWTMQEASKLHLSLTIIPRYPKLSLICNEMNLQVTKILLCLGKCHICLPASTAVNPWNGSWAKSCLVWNKEWSFLISKKFLPGLQLALDTVPVSFDLALSGEHTPKNWVEKVLLSATCVSTWQCSSWNGS